MRLGRFGIFIITPLLVVVATYLVFDRYLARTSRELLSNWLGNEQVSIQEGQLLAAVAKNKRSLNSSDFVRGIWIVDDSEDGVPRVLADFGERIEISKDLLPKKIGQIVVRRIGMFRRLALYRFPEREDLTIAFSVDPDFAWPLFLTNIFAIVALLAVFSLAIRRYEKHEAGERLALIKSALDALAAGASPSRELVAQVPRLVDAWSGMNTELKRASERERVTYSRAKLGAFAKQASHDLISPLTALNTAIKSILHLLPEEKRIETRGALSGLRDLINSLHEKSKLVDLTDSAGIPADVAEPETGGDPIVQLVSTLVEQQLSNSRLQYKLRQEISITSELGPEAYGIFARVNAVDFRRMLANLLTNAVESIDQAGEVSVVLYDKDQEVVLRISDTGKGIPSELIPRLGQLGVTYGKPNGNGSGLHFVRTVAEEWGGSLTIGSIVGKGTTVEVRFPETARPTWFAAEIKIPEDATVIVLDDDPAIHGVWRNRFGTLAVGEKPIPLRSFTSVAELERAFNLSDGTNRHARIYCFDYELAGSTETGLDVIERSGIADKAILVTSHSDDMALIERCMKLGCRMLPKSSAGIVPMQIVASRKRPDCVLIDNDTRIHRAWAESANLHDKQLDRFMSVEEFLVVSQNFDVSTPIYLESDLGDEIRGEEMARYVQSAGFKAIFLQTTKSPESFQSPMPWIKAVVGKTPPWEARV